MATEKKQIKKKVYVTLKEIGPSDKCPPQAKLIIDTIKTAGGKIGRDELITLLKRPVDQGGLKTNQTAERILGFYKPKLTQMGVLREDTEVTEIEVEVPDKPAPAAKAEAPAQAQAAGQTAVTAPKSEKDKKGTNKAA